MPQNCGISMIFEPQIDLIAKTGFLGMPEDISDRWKTDEANPKEKPEFLLEAAGRACYQSWNNPADRTNESYIKNIIEQGHLSVLEHASYTFYLRGVSRSLTHELVRHRVASFSQLSQRYVDESDVAFVVPPAFIGKDDLITTWMASCQESLGQYRDLLRKMLEEYKEDPDFQKIKERRQAARATLPNCVETQMVFTCNVREMRHILEMRGSIGADEEIRRLAIKFFEIMKKEIPAAFFDFELTTEDGKTVIKNLAKT